MRNCVSIPILALVMWLAGSAQTRRIGPVRSSSGQRFALVIGNQLYPDMPLRNTVNDAVETGRALSGLGFQVDLLTNANRRAMEESIDAFRRKLGPNDAALVYYS